MKTTILATLFMFIGLMMSGCSLFEDPNESDPVTITSTIPADIFNAAGGNAIEITHESTGTLTSQVATISGTSYVFTLPTCIYVYDVKVKDPVDYLFWLTNVKVTINYDPLLVSCENLAQCKPNLASVGMTGSTVTGTFSCPVI